MLWYINDCTFFFNHVIWVIVNGHIPSGNLAVSSRKPPCTMGKSSD